MESKGLRETSMHGCSKVVSLVIPLVVPELPKTLTMFTMSAGCEADGATSTAVALSEGLCCYAETNPSTEKQSAIPNAS
eukprot:4083346-Amphidinium_carterae.1